MIKPENLLIVRTDRIGDVVLSLPLAGIIKKEYPRCEVTFLVRKYTSPLTKGNSDITRTIEADEKDSKISLFSNVKKLRMHRFDSCIVVSPTFRIALAMFLSGIKYRIGTGYRWYSFLFNFKLYEHRKYAERHELEYNINLLRFLGINKSVSPENIKYGLQATQNAYKEVDAKFIQWNLDLKNPTIIIHPGSGGSAIDLPIGKWKELIELIATELTINLIITGNVNEFPLCKEIIGQNKAINAAGQLDLDALIALISRGDILLANSTGPIHIAAALDKVVIGFYPKIKACSPERWGPYTKKRVIFTPSIDCSNCTREQCVKLNCMDSISVNEVLEKIKQLLKVQNSGVFNA